ncbi:YdcF family protein [Sporomusa acidovorans]|uniref:YdcF family protein n=2 Tax=Sporomusa acidovorans TaxID=112900 RepID=UPI001FDF4CE0|nr:YdcF family protein [Sporomusa acidovorans]
MSLVVAVFYLMTTPYVSDGLIRSLESQYRPIQNPTGDVIIMLGGGATGDTPDIDGIGHLSGSAANRLLTAARLQKRLNVPVIVSGGKVFEDTGTEALIAQRMLLSLGIPQDKIIIEDQSLNTTQNALYVKQIIEQRHYEQPILVTSAFHMPRSVINFHKVGLAVEPYPADYKVNANSSASLFKFLPSDGAIYNTCTALREYLGMIALEFLH